MSSKSSMAIIGEVGFLANALTNRFQDNYVVTNYSKDQFDFRDNNAVDKLSKKIYLSDHIICCSGVFNSPPWDMLTINALAPVSLLIKLTHLNCKSRIIITGSHSAMWTSWPDISLDRLCYNISKNWLQSAITGLAHSQQTQMLLTLLNISKFQSPVSNWTGKDINVVVDEFERILNNPVPPLLVEMH